MQQALAALRRRLKRALGTFDRVKHEYVTAVYEAIEVEDIVQSRAAGRTSGDHTFRSTLRPPRTGRYAGLKSKAEYWWKVRRTVRAMRPSCGAHEVAPRDVRSAWRDDTCCALRQ